MFNIPKDINAKPRLLGLEIKELIFFIVAIVMIVTALKDMVHIIFTIPYYIVSFGLLLYSILPSMNNSNRKNYHSLLYFFKRDKVTYTPVDITPFFNELMQEEVDEQNNSIKLHLPQELIEKHQEEINKSLINNYEKEKMKMGLDNTKKEGHETKVEKQGEHTKKNKGVIGNILKEEDSKAKKPIIAIAGIVIIGLAFMGLKSGFLDKEESVLAVSEENSKQELFFKEALMSSAIKEYADASVYLDKVNYEELDEEEQEVALLIYLYASKPEKAVELEQGFDEHVASYYANLEDGEKLEELAKSQSFKTEEFKYQLAVMNEDNQTLIEIKDELNLNEQKNIDIVEALIAENEFNQAKRHTEEQDMTSDYESKIEKAEEDFEKEKEEKEKKKEEEEKKKEEKEKKKKKKK